MKLDLGYRFTVGVMKAMALLPLPMLYGVSRFMYFVAYRIFGYRKKVVRVNLRLVFKDKSEGELRAIERKFFLHLCDLMVETVKLLHISDRTMKRRFRVTNPEVIEQLARDGRPIIGFLGHYCNWEWVQAFSLSFPKEMHAGQIYQPLNSKVADRVMLKIRSRFGLENIPQPRAIRRILEIGRGDENFIIGFISDQRPTGRNFHHWTTFLGMDTPFAAGAETLGEKVGAHYIYLDLEKPRRGHYTLTAKPIVIDEDHTYEDFPHTRKFLEMLDETIRRDPAYWLWSHKRWKRLPTGTYSHYYD